MKTNSRPPTIRRGVALVEMIAIISALGTLLTLSAVVLKNAYTAHHHALQQFQDIEQLSVWMDRFQSDVHQAVDVQQVAEAAILKTNHGTQIEYKLEQGVLLRSVRDDQQTLRWEGLRPLKVAALDWQIDRQSRGPLVRVELEIERGERHYEPVVWLARVGVNPAAVVAAVTPDVSKPKVVTEPSSDSPESESRAPESSDGEAGDGV